jgi:HlyD family secretion protein
MDRAIEKPTWSPGRLALGAAAAVALVTLVVVVLQRSGTSRLTVDPTRLSISRVAIGEFREFYPFDGTVVPETSVYLDVEEGGRVEAILTEGGLWVEQGTPILRISNTTLQSSTINTETQLLENLDQLANTQFNRAQNSLMLKDSLLDMDYRILELQKKFDRYEILVNNALNPLSREEYERVRDELQYQKDKRALLQERIRQEDILSARQLEQATNSAERHSKSLELLTQMVANLEVKAPISGYLSSIDAELGQSIGRGARIGQIDVLDAFKIRVAVDQFYVSRIAEGTEGKFRLDDQDYPVVVRKIYPEVINDVFQVDVDFVGPVPAGIRRGQSLTIELNFGAAAEALMVRKGGFYQQTGGRWAYLVSADGGGASKVDIRLGRQNPQFVEVLEGLAEDDWVITSGYDTFNEIDQLVFSEALELQD